MQFIDRKLNKELKRTFFVLINPHLSRLLPPHNFVAMHYILTKTLGFGYDHFTTSFMFSVKDKTKILPLISTMSQPAFYKSLVTLRELNFIYHHPNSRPAQYIVNSPAIIFAILKLFTLAELPVNERTRHVNVANKKYDIYSKNKVYLPRNLNLPETMFMDIVEAIIKGKDTTKKAKDKKLEKIKKKQDPSVSNMIYLFTNACKDLDVKCYFLTRFTGKEAGQAKQFISECKEGGLQLSEVIEDICKYWRKFRIGALTTEKGSEIILNSSVNFPDFFVNRHKILMTINSRRSVWDAEASQVVQINHVDLYATDTQPYKH